MAFPSTGISDVYRQELLKGGHNFTTSTGDTIKLALFTNSAVFTGATATFAVADDTGEVVGTGYTAGGNSLTIEASMPTLATVKAFTGFGASTAFTSATFTARGCVFYNTTGPVNDMIQFHNFGSDKTVTAATFTINFPTTDSTNAIIRLA